MTDALLLPHHLAMLTEESGIALELIEQRGYRTIMTPQDLFACEFSKAQSRCVPGLLLPLWRVDGTQSGWMFRPDSPRYDRKGEPRKYEQRKGATNILDVHPAVQRYLQAPAIPLWITEGVRKGDALANHGQCTIALTGGVWGFRGKNAYGGTMILPDWQDVALNGRIVYIVYDNDVMRKPTVGKALRALESWLTSREALPQRILLPDDGKKQGVDDFLAAGHSIEDLLALRQAPDTPLHPTPADGLPVVDQYRHRLPDVVAQAEDVLRMMPHAPLVFQRARRLVGILPAETVSPHVTRIPGSPIITPLSLPKIRLVLAWTAHWRTPTRAGTLLHEDMPASWLCETLLDLGHWETIPPLTGILHTPTLRPDGSILDHLGYDEATGLWLAWETLFPPVPNAPTAAQVQDALTCLCEPFKDFPFAAEHHRSAALAAVLTLIGRSASYPQFSF